MPSWIEFHDSELISAARSDLEVSILLDAYVHRWDDGDRRKGTGWMQQVRLNVGRAVGSFPTLVALLSSLTDRSVLDPCRTAASSRCRFNQRSP
jgi:hypothetical protein